MKFFLTLLFIAFVVISYAQPGTPDKSYGADKTGTVSLVSQIYIESSAMQPDDKLLLAGSGNVGVFNVVRHNKDGGVDTTFGNKGQATTTVDDLVSNIISTGGWDGIAVQPDGKIVMVGAVNWYNPDFPGDVLRIDNDIVVARLMPDGTPDESFGIHGRVVTNLGQAEAALDIAVQPDGKIFIAGLQQLDFYGYDRGILLVRYNADGTLDESFGEGMGYVKYTKERGSTAYAMLIQPDGKVVAGGSGGIDNFFLIRYMPDGTIDESFGDGGQVKTSFGMEVGPVKITSLALDANGRIVAAGVVQDYERGAVVRYLPDGTLDNSFNEDGKLELSFATSEYTNTFAVFAHADNKLIVSSIISTGGINRQLVLTGLNADGSLDASFGTDNGQTVTNTKIISVDNVAAAKQSDGRIVVAGNDYDDRTNIIMNYLTRFNGYPSQVPLYVRIKRWLKNHGISWKGLPAQDNIAYYSLERSSDRTTGFTQIAKVSGTNHLSNYDITNSQLLPGTNYYRIKAVSTDGAIRYSEVVSADNSAATASVYPNPVRDYVTVQGLKSNEQANISIANSSGTVVAKGISSGSTQYRAAAANLQRGTYFLNITTNSGKTETLQFVKE